MSWFEQEIVSEWMKLHVDLLEQLGLYSYHPLLRISCSASVTHERKGDIEKERERKREREREIEEARERLREMDTDKDSKIAILNAFNSLADSRSVSVGAGGMMWSA